MQGIHLTATAMTWPPYIALQNCSENGEKCQKYGFLVEVMDTWAKELNFSWDIYKDINNEWGLNPISGMIF